jgi:uncharacterized membrane protein YeaQ/YmgE (transglycosylase-associated protein family)
MIMVLFAETGSFSLFPDGIMTWALIGVAIGFLAGFTLQPGQLGLVGDAVAGVIGAVAGGLTVFYLVEGTTGFLVAIGVAAVSAGVLVGILRKVMTASD